MGLKMNLIYVIGQYFKCEYESPISVGHIEPPLNASCKFFLNLGLNGNLHSLQKNSEEFESIVLEPKVWIHSNLCA